MNPYTLAMRNYLTVEGRTSRKNFWLFTLIVTVALFVALIIDMVVFSTPAVQRNFLFLIVACVHIVPFIAASVRRLHDADLTGWLYLLNALPFGQIIFVLLACLPSTPGTNKYGDVDSDEGLEHVAGQRSHSYRVVTDVEPTMSSVQQTPSAPAHVKPPEEPRTPSAARSASLDDGLLAQLERLASLRASGVIDDQEFATLKAKLLPVT